MKTDAGMKRPGAAPARFAAPIALAMAMSGCMSFATVRSAVVPAGPSLVVQGAAASPPGDAAGWFWSIDCTDKCSRPIAGGDVAMAYGFTGTPMPFTIGGGVNGLNPYVEGYVQLRRDARVPVGIGARVGVPTFSWNNHQAYARVDIPIDGDVSLLWNPGIVYHTGNSPNGENPGSFLGIVQAIGLQARSGRIAFIPSGGVVWGRAERTSYGRKIGPEHNLFGFASVAIRFARRQ